MALCTYTNKYCTGERWAAAAHRDTGKVYSSVQQHECESRWNKRSDRRLEVKKRSTIHTSNLGSLNEIISFLVSEVPIRAQGSERVHRKLRVFIKSERKSGDECTAATAFDLHRPIRCTLNGVGGATGVALEPFLPSIFRKTLALIIELDRHRMK